VAGAAKYKLAPSVASDPAIGLSVIPYNINDICRFLAYNVRADNCRYKAMARKVSIGRAESEVLRFLVEHPGATVSEVADHFAHTKGLSRNTTQTMMERLRTKGYLEREKEDGAFRYRPVQTGGAVLDGLLDDFVRNVLGGSLSPVVAYLTRRVDVSEAQLEELKRLVAELEEEGEDA